MAADDNDLELPDEDLVFSDEEKETQEVVKRRSKVEQFIVFSLIALLIIVAGNEFLAQRNYEASHNELKQMDWTLSMDKEERGHSVEDVKSRLSGYYVESRITESYEFKHLGNKPFTVSDYLEIQWPAIRYYIISLEMLNDRVTSYQTGSTVTQQESSAPVIPKNFAPTPKEGPTGIRSN